MIKLNWTEIKFTFVCFFEVYAGVILRMSKSNSESATNAICFVPVSKIEKTDAGCSELCRRCTIFGETVNMYFNVSQLNSYILMGDVHHICYLPDICGTDVYVSQSTRKWPTCTAPKATTLLVRKSMIAGPVLFSNVGNGCKLFVQISMEKCKWNSKEILT